MGIHNNKYSIPENKAHEYAISTTTTRCSKIGRCKDCKVRNCDYRSRRDAFLKGWEAMYSILFSQPPFYEFNNTSYQI